MGRSKAELLAIERDGPLCQRCGKTLWDEMASVHHRKSRRFPDADRVENLVVLCGSGSTGCHQWAHANPDEARVGGWVVASWDDPALVPLVPLAGPSLMLFADGSVQWEVAGLWG